LPSPILYGDGIKIRGGGRGGGGVKCAMVGEEYCRRVGFAGGGGGNERMVDSRNKALK